MKKYIEAISALNNATLSNPNKDDIERCAESDIFWAKHKNKKLIDRKPRKGSIYQFEFGKNYIPEMSYEHRGLVVGISGKLLYVLPICSYNHLKKEHCAAYHPLSNPTSKSNYFLLKEEEFNFLKHDSVLKLNDIRTVSTARIKYKQDNGFLSPSSDTYKQIVKIVFTKYFPEFAYEYENVLNENKKLKDEISTLKNLSDS